MSAPAPAMCVAQKFAEDDFVSVQPSALQVWPLQNRLLPTLLFLHLPPVGVGRWQRNASGTGFLPIVPAPVPVRLLAAVAAVFALLAADGDEAVRRLGGAMS